MKIFAAIVSLSFLLFISLVSSEEPKDNASDKNVITFDFLPYSDEEPCSCGSASMHYGIDFASPQRTDVNLIANSDVVKIETDKNAVVYVSDAGSCGRYVVFLRKCSNGKSFYIRYAHLENIIDKEGKPLAEGMSFNRGDKIAETGDNSFFHLEIRPADVSSPANKQSFDLVYAEDKEMEWTKYAAVDPEAIDVETCSVKED